MGRTAGVTVCDAAVMALLADTAAGGVIDAGAAVDPLSA